MARALSQRTAISDLAEPEQEKLMLRMNAGVQPRRPSSDVQLACRALQQDQNRSLVLMVVLRRSIWRLTSLEIFWSTSIIR